MEPEVHNLPIYGEPDMDLLRSAKQTLAVDWRIKVRPAVPGDERVLSFAGTPNFACDYAASKNWIVSNLADAIRWVIEGGVDNRVVRMEQWLEKALGTKGVHEV